MLYIFGLLCPSSILGPYLEKRLGKHSMVTIDEGKAVIIGGYSNEDQSDQDAIYLITCSNRSCERSTLDYTLSKPRQGFVAIPLPDTTECTIKPTNPTTEATSTVSSQKMTMYMNHKQVLLSRERYF